MPKTPTKPLNTMNFVELVNALQAAKVRVAASESMSDATQNKRWREVFAVEDALKAWR